MRTMALLAFLAPAITASAVETEGQRFADAPRPVSRPIPVIFDTDMESDVDDVGALALLHALADLGEAEILAVTVCAGNPWSPLCADRLNHYYGRGEVPVGTVKGRSVRRDSRYTSQIAEEFPGRLAIPDEVPDALDILRRALAAQPDGSVVVVSVGYLTNLRDLLVTGADEHSDLDGRKLVARKVRLWACMGGHFPSGREFNIFQDTEASREALAGWPTEIVFSGWEVGLAETGGPLRELPATSPVRRAYELYRRIPHKSWDLMTVLYAVRGIDRDRAGGYWDLSPRGRMVLAENGANTWQTDPGGNQRYKLLQDGQRAAKLVAEIDDLLMRPPGP